jgi:hypothetical protein
VQVQVLTYRAQNDNIATYQSDIYFVVNSKKQNPNVFKLMVASDGQIVPADKKGQLYLSTRTNWKLTQNSDASFTERNILEDDDRNKIIDWLSNDTQLPDGHKIAEPQPAAYKLRRTKARGVYCQQVGDDGTYNRQKHYYWSGKMEKWIELEGVYHVSSSDYDFSPYNGDDADEINNFGINW